MSIANVIPTDLRQLRACMICSLIKTQQQFVEDGCENCDEFVGMAGDTEKIGNCTTPSFEGMIAMMIPSESWVAKWQRITKFTPGMYATAVHGHLPTDTINELAGAGYKYHSRNPNDV